MLHCCLLCVLAGIKKHHAMTPREEKKMQGGAVTVLISGAAVVYAVAFSFANDFGRTILAVALAATVVSLAGIFYGLKKA